MRLSQLFETPRGAETSPGEPVTVGAISRGSAALHVAAIVPATLPIAGTFCWSPSPFLRHHARQAAGLSAGILAVGFVHWLLHLGIVGVGALHEQLHDLGRSETMTWVSPLLGLLRVTNLAAMGLELGCLACLALLMAHGAARGRWWVYPFLGSLGARRTGSATGRADG